MKFGQTKTVCILLRHIWIDMRKWSVCVCLCLCAWQKKTPQIHSWKVARCRRFTSFYEHWGNKMHNNSEKLHRSKSKNYGMTWSIRCKCCLFDDDDDVTRAMHHTFQWPSLSSPHIALSAYMKRNRLTSTRISFFFWKFVSLITRMSPNHSLIHTFHVEHFYKHDIKCLKPFAHNTRRIDDTPNDAWVSLSLGVWVCWLLLARSHKFLCERVSAIDVLWVTTIKLKHSIGRLHFVHLLWTRLQFTHRIIAWHRVKSQKKIQTESDSI